MKIIMLGAKHYYIGYAVNAIIILCFLIHLRNTSEPKTKLYGEWNFYYYHFKKDVESERLFFFSLLSERDVT